MNPRIHVVARFAVKPEVVTEFAALATRLLVQPTQAEPGCIRYELTRDIAEPTRFAMLETWTSADTLAAHLAQPNLAAALNELRSMIAAAPVVEKFVDVSD